MTQPSTEDALFLRAARGENTERAPIWLMRQAGRYLPEYRKLKETYSFWELCRTPELGMEVTLQPLRRFGFDAAILFSDIMTPLPPMGVDIDFAPGPIIAEPVRSAAAVEALRIPEADEIAPFVQQEIKLLRQELKVPLIGFGGAPLTLATYLIEGKGSKEYQNFRAFLRAEPEAAHQLLDKLTETSIRYLTMQIEAGAQAIQLFDSWAGLHNAETYETFAMPYVKRILDALAVHNVPRIYLAVASSHLYPQIATLPADVISVDWRLPLGPLRERFPGKTLQGNLDPAVMLSNPASIKREAERVLREGLGGAHIFNFGHGIFPTTPPEHVAHLVDTVHQFDRTKA
jgi:uroporphyrinogen decarboxylase